MTTEHLISIIVPAYNGGPYIRRCAESILAQTHPHLELIVVDDCSTDDTSELLQPLAARDSRLRVLRLPENQGVHAARAAGLSVARGTYTGFVDADDWVAPEMYATLLQAALAEDADIAICGATLASSPNELGPAKVRFRTRQVYRDDLLGRFCRLQFKSGVLWNKLYRKTIIEPPARANLERYVDAAEDYIVNLGAFAAARRVVTLPVALYYYFEYAGSASRVGSTAKNFCRTLRAYVASLELYKPSLPGAVGHIDRLYARQLQHECYCVRSHEDLEPFQQDLEESLVRLARVHPAGVYSLVHAFDEARATDRARPRQAARRFAAAGKNLAFSLLQRAPR